MNQVPAIVWNPAYVEEPEPDEDEKVDPADLAPFISGNTPTISIPASEDEEVAGEVTADGAEGVIQGLEELTQEIKNKTSPPCEDAGSEQHAVVPNVDIWNTEKAIEQEYRLHPNLTIKGLRDRLDEQVWALLRIIQERVDQNTCNNIDMRLVDGQNAISVMHTRLGIINDISLKCQAKKP